MFKYKLKEEFIQDGERTIIGVGVTQKGFIESATPLESPVLELVQEAAPAPQTPAAPVVAAPQTQTPAPAAPKENE